MAYRDLFERNPWLRGHFRALPLVDQLNEAIDTRADQYGIPEADRAAAFRYAIADGIRDSEPGKFTVLQIFGRLRDWHRERAA